MFSLRQRSVLPGFKLTLGYTLLYLSLIVLIAAILAAATYVMVREKTEEQERGGPATSPS